MSFAFSLVVAYASVFIVLYVKNKFFVTFVGKSGVVWGNLCNFEADYLL